MLISDINILIRLVVLPSHSSHAASREKKHGIFEEKSMPKISSHSAWLNPCGRSLQPPILTLSGRNAQQQVTVAVATGLINGGK
ncbi:MAG: hypothetical protein C5B51_21935 [Terriglobia bacterium]|nr:MAG: hypothetical protein C5B51_21935 [Terriglobia bacterium]